MSRRLIDATELEKIYAHNSITDIVTVHDKTVMQHLKDAQTIDAVQVVRCKDCVYYRPQKQSAQWNHSKRYCMRKAATKVTPYDYCSFGERGSDGKIH